MKKLTLALAILVLLPGLAQAQRLPRTVVPNHYELMLTPDFKTDTFTGEEVIHVSVTEATSQITLNAAEIAFQKVVVESQGQEQKAEVALDEKAEQATFKVAKRLSPGPAKIRISYQGKLNGDLRGFYLGNSNGQKYAGSQMEASDSRRAFPGFDEPWMKSTFDISFVVDEGLSAFSNGPQISDTKGPKGKHTVRFGTTPKMSTYLVALTVGNFECLKDEFDGIPLRVCAAPDKVQYGKYALEATKAALGYFNKYFEYKYPFGKLDQIAIADFGAGAMENTGAIIYRETALLLDPATASTNQQRRVANVIAHEIGHMWFGDLVTMRWWDDIWLNEGFATFIASKSVESWKPEWNVGVQEAAASGQPIGIDSLKATRQIRQQATTPMEIDSLFDGIAYGKTAAVLRMVESYIGEDTMRKGIAQYMKDHAYGNTVAADFYDALSNASGKDVAAVMRSYVEQPGVPLVDVQAVCQGKTTEVTLKQQRFFADPRLLGSAPDQVWTVPVCFGDEKSNRELPGPQCVLLSSTEKKATIEGCQDVAFGNWDGRGYYLTNYPTEAQRKKLRAGIAKRDATERLVLLRDEWYLVRTGRRAISDYLALVAAVAPAERELRVVEEYTERLDYLAEEIVTPGDLPTFRSWVGKLLKPVGDELGWQPKAGETVPQMELRATVLGTLGGVAEDADTLARAGELARKYLDDRSALHPTLAGVAVNLAAKEGDAALYERYFKTYLETKVPEESRTFMEALARFEKPELRARSLDLVLSPDIRNQDTARFLGGIGNSSGAQEVTWKFVQDKYKDILARLPKDNHGALLPAAGAGFCDEKLRDEFEKFAASVDTVLRPRAMALTRERIGNCLELKKLQGVELAQFLAKQKTGLAQASK